jgi:hypothetical protein
MAQLPFESDEVTLRRRNPWFAAAALLLGLVAPPLLVAVAVVAHHLVLLGLAPLAALAGVLLWSANPAPRERLGRLVVNELGVFFEGRRLAPVSAVREGYLVTVPGDAPIVRIVGAGSLREVRVKNEAAGRQLLRALGVWRTAPGRAIRLPSRVVTSPASFAQVTLVAVLLPLIFTAIGLASHRHLGLFVALIGVAAAAVAFVLASLLAATTLTIGAEGITIGWLTRRRRIGYAEIASVRLYEEAQAFSSRRERGISLVLRSGELVRLPAERGAEAEGLRGLVEQIEDAIARHRRGEPAPEEGAVARRGRSPAEWLRALRAIGSGAGADHRTAPVPSDVLWRLVEDDAATPETRAGAAVALSGSLDDAGRARLRIAAEKAVVPRLRVAIEAAAAGGDGPAVEEALAELEAEEMPVTAREPRGWSTG